MNIGKLVGNTPMIKIDYEFEGKKGSIYTKVEYYNYSGSIKDRIALYIIQKEKERGNGFTFAPCPKNGIAHTITTTADRKTNTFIDEGERVAPIQCGSLSLSTYRLEAMRRIYSSRGVAVTIHTKADDYPYYLIEDD